MAVHLRHMCTKGAQPWLFTFDTDTADNRHQAIGVKLYCCTAAFIRFTKSKFTMNDLNDALL